MPAYLAGMDWVFAYSAAKLRILAFSGADRALIHVHAGLAIYLMAQMAAQVVRLPRPALWGLTAVMVATALNEALDALATGGWMPERLGMAMLTLAWPLALFLSAHVRRWHLAQRRLRATLDPEGTQISSGQYARQTSGRQTSSRHASSIPMVGAQPIPNPIASRGPVNSVAKAASGMPPTLAPASALRLVAPPSDSTASRRNPVASPGKALPPRLRVFPGYAAHWAHRPLPERQG